jgi:DNA polymerase-3 subunit epsilon
MLLCGLDFETTGLKIGTVSVVEVGLVLWDTDMRAPVKLAGYLVDPGADAVWEPGVEKINHITPELCSKYGVVELTGLKQLLSWYAVADYAVAHNGLEFDRPILRHWAEKHKLDWQADKIWIDTKCDLEIPQRDSTRLVYMAADHAFLNPFPHRAVFDVMTMMKILDCYEIDEVLKVSKSPTLVVQALVSFADRDKARTRGFHAQYETNGKFKAWTMVVKQCYFEREQEGARAAGFDIEVIKTKY